MAVASAAAAAVVAWAAVGSWPYWMDTAADLELAEEEPDLYGWQARLAASLRTAHKQEKRQRGWKWGL